MKAAAVGTTGSDDPVQTACGTELVKSMKRENVSWSKIKMEKVAGDSTGPMSTRRCIRMMRKPWLFPSRLSQPRLLLHTSKHQKRKHIRAASRDAATRKK